MCKVCRRKTDSDNMLLCDSCDTGYHIYCLKPKLKAIPSGDWFCPECKPKERVRSPKKKVRRTFSQTEDSDEDPDETPPRKKGKSKKRLIESDDEPDTVKNTKVLRPGNVLAATYKKEGYHRVMVIEVVDINVVKIFYVDYGTVENQKVKNCRFLLKDFATFPGQAIQARLWGVKPVGGGKGWGSGNKARDKLVELTETLEGSLVAKIMAGITRKEVTVKGAHDLEEDRGLALSLLDIFAGDEGLDIATELVTEGVAEWDVWDVQEEVEIETGNTVLKVVKYPGHDEELLVEKIGNSKTGVDVVDESDEVRPSPYLRLL